MVEVFCIIIACMKANAALTVTNFEASALFMSDSETLAAQ